MIKRLTQSDITESAYIHWEGMREDFLPGFGIPFLKKLHKYLLQSRHVIGLGIFEEKQLMGVLFAAISTQKAMNYVYRHGYFEFLPHLIKRLVTSPGDIKFLWETMFYSRNRPDSPECEILILSLRQTARRQGYGSQLISGLKNELSRQNVDLFKVGTLITNLSANNFYKKTGGVFKENFRIYGKIWNVYYYKV